MYASKYSMTSWNINFTSLEKNVRNLLGSSLITHTRYNDRPSSMIWVWMGWDEMNLMRWIGYDSRGGWDGMWMRCDGSFGCAPNWQQIAWGLYLLLQQRQWVIDVPPAMLILYLSRAVNLKVHSQQLASTSRINPSYPTSENGHPPRRSLSLSLHPFIRYYCHGCCFGVYVCFEIGYLSHFNSLTLLNLSSLYY